MPSQAKRIESLLRQDIATKADLAEALDKSPRTIERWVRLRRLPQPRKFGNEVIWTGHALRQCFGLEVA